MDNEQTKVMDLSSEKKESSNETISDDEVTLNNPLLAAESKSNPLPNKISQLKISVPRYKKASYPRLSNPPCTPVENILSNFDSCIMFTPVKKNGDHRQPPISLMSYASSQSWDEHEKIEIKEMSCNNTVIEKYYPTTSCSALCLRLLRFIRMFCIILPVVSIIGTLFTHTKYVKFFASTISNMWALLPNIQSHASLANILSGLTIGIIVLILVIVVFRFLWAKLIKKKFLTHCKIKLQNIKSDIEKILFYKDNLANELERLGLIGNKSDAVLIEHPVESKTAYDCYILYFKYLSLVQRYNTDRMGPYDIAKERLASQFRVFAVFLLLMIGVYDQSNLDDNTFEGKQINYGKIYSLIIGLLKNAQIQSIQDHQKSSCFSWLKTHCTQSHYALMLGRLLADEIKDKNDNAIFLYHNCYKKSILFHSLIIGAEATSKFVTDDNDIMEIKHSDIKPLENQSDSISLLNNS